ncbi:MAG: 50S ribosomal protein L29 [Deltaproteobacteria bacterium]|nr:50S ribosomal protein L29 [Deltaproteobacteria bacterium]
MKAIELRELSEEDLKEKEKDLSRELFNLRFQKASGQLGNSAMIPKTRRDIARVKTVLNDLKMSMTVK